MINEYQGSYRHVSRINGQAGGRVDLEASAHASQLYAAEFGDGSSQELGLGVFGRARQWLERVFLASGYPNSVSPDLVPVARWDFVQVVCSSVSSTLATRSVLVGVGVGVAAANVAGSVASWMMRDGVWLVSSVVFSSLISSGLDCRAKSWRLVADICNDAAFFIELCSPFFATTGFICMITLASVLKALVAVCGSGSRTALLLHFAAQGNAADVQAKAANRDNVGSLAGLLLGMAVSFATPLSSVSGTFAVFSLFAAGHVFANFMCVRRMVLAQLNAPRLEWCMDAFLSHQSKREAAAKKSDDRSPESDEAYMSPRRANAAEALSTLPAGSRWWLPGMLPALQVPIHYGVAFTDVLRRHNESLTTAEKHELVTQVSAELSTRGVAMVFSQTKRQYYVLFPEEFSRDGHPMSWATFRREAARMRVMDAKEQAAEEAGSQPVTREGPQFEPFEHRLLWAYFYAYNHTRAAGRVEPSGGSDIPTRRSTGSLFVIDGLRADGVLSVSRDSDDALLPLYDTFVSSLAKQGWQLDRVLVQRQNCTIAIDYL